MSRARTTMPWVVAALGAAVYLLLDPPSADLAAQEYRAQLVRDAGLAIWDNGWFAGHHTPAYSVLFPPLGALLGVRLAGALAVVAAAALFARLARRHWAPPAATAASAWFALGCVAMLLTGRMTFLLGVAIATGALLALSGARRTAAVVLAALTAAASPVAALFLALAAVAVAATTPERRTGALLVAAAALAPALALAALFPEGGDEPFVASSFWPALAAIALVAVLLPARERALRAGAGLYALATVAAFALSTPVGGNVTRLGALVAGPVVLGTLVGRRRPALLAAVALPLAYWALYPPVRDVVRATGDPSVQAAYHAPLVRFLESRPRRFPRRDPVHREPLGGRARRASRPARARLAAPARPPLRRALLRRQPHRRQLPRLARRARRRVRRAARRRARRRRPRRGAARRARPALPAPGLARRALARLRRPRPGAARERARARRRAAHSRRLRAARAARGHGRRARPPHALVARHRRARVRAARPRRDDARAACRSPASCASRRAWMAAPAAGDTPETPSRQRPSSVAARWRARPRHRGSSRPPSRSRGCCSRPRRRTSPRRSTAPASSSARASRSSTPTGTAATTPRRTRSSTRRSARCSAPASPGRWRRSPPPSSSSASRAGTSATPPHAGARCGSAPAPRRTCSSAA